MIAPLPIKTIISVLFPNQCPPSLSFPSTLRGLRRHGPLAVGPVAYSATLGALRNGGRFREALSLFDRLLASAGLPPTEDPAAGRPTGAGRPKGAGRAPDGGLNAAGASGAGAVGAAAGVAALEGTLEGGRGGPDAVACLHAMEVEQEK